MSIQIGDVYRRERENGRFIVFELVEVLRSGLYRFEILENNYSCLPNFSGNENYAPRTVYSIGAEVILKFCVRVDYKEISKEDIV